MNILFAIYVLINVANTKMNFSTYIKLKNIKWQI